MTYLFGEFGERIVIEKPQLISFSVLYLPVQSAIVFPELVPFSRLCGQTLHILGDDLETDPPFLCT